MFSIDHFEPDFDHDYAGSTEMDQADEARDCFLAETFWWMEESERWSDILRGHADFPGVDAEFDKMREFAASFRFLFSRRVPCLFQLDHATMPGIFDLVTMDAFVLNDGRYELAVDLPPVVTINFPDAVTKRMKHSTQLYHCDVFYGTVRRPDESAVRDVIRELHYAKKLPPLSRI